MMSSRERLYSRRCCGEECLEFAGCTNSCTCVTGWCMRWTILVALLLLASPVEASSFSGLFFGTVSCGGTLSVHRKAYVYVELPSEAGGVDGVVLMPTLVEDLPAAVYSVTPGTYGGSGFKLEAGSLQMAGSVNAKGRVNAVLIAEYGDCWLSGTVTGRK